MVGRLNGMKTCARCKRRRRKTSFAKNRGRKDGLQPYCRDCHKELRQERKRRVEPQMEGEKRCCACKAQKAITEFNKHAGRPDGRDTRCRACMRGASAEHYAQNREKRKKQTTNARRKRVAVGSTTERDYSASYRRAKRGAVEWEMSRRRTDARKRALRHDLTFDLSVESLVELWEQQEGRCALSGQLMELGSTGQREPWTASIDRIDATRGYTMDNVRLVTWMVNRALASWSDEALLQMCRGVVEQHG